MKAFILFALLLLAAALAGCSDVGNTHNAEGTDGYVTKYQFEGHDYLIYDGISSGATLHSASCPCGRGGR